MHDNTNDTSPTGHDMSGRDAVSHDNTRHDAADLDSKKHTFKSLDQHHYKQKTVSDIFQPNVATQHGASRHSATEHDASRHDANSLDEARQDMTSRYTSSNDATESDQPSSVLNEVGQSVEPQSKIEAPRDIADWVIIEIAADILADNGITRTHRTVQRMCQRGDLIARLVPTENGSRYIVERGSIMEYIDRHNQKLPVGDAVPSERQNEAPSNVPTEDSASMAEPQQMHGASAEILEIKNEQITFLKEQLTISNEQIRVKDEQINTMLERDHETNVLIQNLQNILSQQTTHDHLPERRAVRLHDQEL